MKKLSIKSIIATVIVITLFSIMPLFTSNSTFAHPTGVVLASNTPINPSSSSGGNGAGQQQQKIKGAAGTISDQQQSSGGGTPTATFTGSCRNEFFGLTSWDCNVNISDEETLKSGIWQIVANIATDITVVAAYLVLGYVIYGGYLYIFSSGDPGKLAGAKKTLTHAFIGLAIVMCAYVIMNTIRIALIGNSGAFSHCVTQQCVSANDLVTHAIQWVIGVAGAVAAIFVLYGGISYITSSGDPGKLQKAKHTIMYALIGLIIVALAEIITSFVSGMIRDAKSSANWSTTTISQTITSKEYHEKNHI